MEKISKLTLQQDALLDEYKIKWQLIALSSQPIDKQKVTEAIEAVHQKLSKIKEFNIYFFDSPLGVANLSFFNKIYPTENWCNPKKLNNLIRQIENQLLKNLFSSAFNRDIVLPSIEVVGRQLDIELWHYLERKLMFWSPLIGLVPVNLKDKEKSSSVWKSAKSNQQRRLEGLWFLLTSGLVTPDAICGVCCLLDYCISELQCTPEEGLWSILKTFAINCGWTFFFQNFCFTCDRPCKIIRAC